MDKQDRTEFENQWADAFNDAEIDVSDNVWEKIEMNVLHADNEKVKRRLLFFQILAAASIAFALSVSGIVTYKYYIEKGQQIDGNNNNLLGNNSTVEANVEDDMVSVITEPVTTNSNLEAGTKSSRDNLTSTNGPRFVDETKAAEITSKELSDVAAPHGENSVSSVTTDHKKERGQLQLNSVGDDKGNIAATPSIENNFSDLQQEQGEGVYTSRIMRNYKLKEAQDLGDVNNLVVNNIAYNNGTVGRMKYGGNIMLDSDGAVNKPYAIGVNDDVHRAYAVRNRNSKDAEVSAEHGNGAGKSYLKYKGDEVPLLLDSRSAMLEVDSSLLNREMEMVPWFSYAPAQEEEVNEAKEMWAGVNFSAGKFDPNTGGVGGASVAQMNFEGNSINYKRNPVFGGESSGQSMNVGVNVGTKIAKRWVVQGGVGYQQQQSSSTSNVIATSGYSVAGKDESKKTVKSFNSLQNDDAGTEYLFTSPYEVVNTYELFEVPIQAGYVLIDRKFNVTVLSGISNNILIKNTFDDQGEGLEKLTMNAGSESLYKTYQISGLLGSEFSYEFDEKYILSIMPQVRQAINSITKSEADFDSRPTIWEVGFRFKYIF